MAEAAAAEPLRPPFPAMTPGQRLHLEVNGYAVIPGLLTCDECDWISGDLRRLRNDLRAQKPGVGAEGPVIDSAYFAHDHPHHTYIGALGQSKRYPGILHYLSHPLVVGLAEELLGGTGHILEVNAHLNRRAPSWPTAADGGAAFGFHRGMVPATTGDGNHLHDGLFHSSFVKVLTNLTDLGPDDGGTTVIAGSHKIDHDQEAVIAAAYEDRSLIHQIVAPKGSAVLFTEALIHATGQILSDRERIIMIAGYGTTHFPWKYLESHRPDFELDAAFLAAVPPSVRHLYESKGYISRTPRYRALADSAETRAVPAPSWPYPRF